MLNSNNRENPSDHYPGMRVIKSRNVVNYINRMQVNQQISEKTIENDKTKLLLKEKLFTFFNKLFNFMNTTLNLEDSGETHSNGSIHSSKYNFVAKREFEWAFNPSSNTIALDYTPGFWDKLLYYSLKLYRNMILSLELDYELNVEASPIEQTLPADIIEDGSKKIIVSNPRRNYSKLLLLSRNVIRSLYKKRARRWRAPADLALSQSVFGHRFIHIWCSLFRKSGFN